MGAVCRVLEDDSSGTEPDTSDMPPPRPLKKVWGGDIPDHLIKMFEEGSKYLGDKQKHKLAEILSTYRETFVRSSTELGLSKVGEHKINTGEHPPVKERLRRVPLHRRKLVEEKIKEMLEVGVIQPSESPWSACPVLVTKTDGSVRWCVDWRKLNNITVKDSYPMPRVDECIEALEGCSWFSSLDLQHGYWQIPMRQEDWQKTAFSTHLGLYEFTRTPMGVSNAPATFQRLMETVLNGLDMTIAIIYIDDIIVPGRTFEQAAAGLEKVLKRLSDNGLKLKTKKCHLFQREVQFLGHMVSKEGLRPVGAKVQALFRWPRPTNIKQVQGFLGLANYYRRMISDYAEIAIPLTNLLKKDVPFVWTRECQEAFDILKSKLMEEPIMAYPVDKCPFILDTDASNLAAGAVLSQVQDGQERVIAYWSKAWSQSQKHYDVPKRELLAALLAMEAFGYYLRGLSGFTLRTDHACLRWLHNSKNASDLVTRWQERLSQFNFTVEHRPGKNHGNADSLSRRPCPDCGVGPHPPELECEPKTFRIHSMLMAQGQGELPPVRKKKRKPRKKKQKVPLVDLPLPDGKSVYWSPELVVQHQHGDPVLKHVIAWKKESRKPPWEEISTQNSMLKYWWTRFSSLRLAPGTDMLEMSWVSPSNTLRWRIVVPISLRKSLLREWHDSLQGGHLGSNKSWNRAKRSGFYWESMRRSVREHVRECLTCARNKVRGTAKNHPMLPMKTGHKFEMIGMDLVGPLPVTERRNKYMLVITDYWTRWCEAIPIPNKESATVAGTFMRVWVSRYGCPQSILTDQGKEFDSNLFKECCNLMQSWKVRTSPFHPRCNGLTERLNQTIERMLTAFVAENQLDWDEKLPFVMMAYRSAVQESTGVTPHAMIFGDELPVPLDWVFGNPKKVPRDHVLYVKELRNKIQSAYEIARKSMLTAVLRQKREYNKGIRNVQFNVGDFVMCHDKTKKLHRNPSLMPKWRGPFIVINKLNPANCTIQREAVSKPINVHVDRLKHCFPQRKQQFKWAQKLLKTTHPEVVINFKDETQISQKSLSESEGIDKEVELNTQVSPTNEDNSDFMTGSGMSSLQSSTGQSSDSERALYDGKEALSVGRRVIRLTRKQRAKKNLKNFSTGNESEIQVKIDPRDRKTCQGLKEPVVIVEKLNEKVLDKYRRDKSVEKSIEKPIPAPRKSKLAGKPAPAPIISRGGRTIKPPNRLGFSP